MFKRIIAAMTAALTMLGAFQVSFAADKGYSDISDNPYYEDIMELTQIGLVNGYDDGTFHPNISLTRAEFSQLAASMLNMDLSASKTYFTDVGPDHWAYGPIGFMVAKGYLKGYEDQTFRPDNEISFHEAVAILIRILGYQYKADRNGGYPYGYYTVASELSMLKGINLSGETILKRDAACKIINNALDIPLVELTGVDGESGSYETDPEVTPLTRYLKMERGTGIVTANEFVSVRNTPLASEDEIIVNGEHLACRQSEDQNFVGYRVKYVYKLDEDSEIKNLIDIRKVDNTELTVEREDFLSCKDGTFLYEDSSDKERRVSLSPTIDIIYNGEWKAFDESIFEAVKYGSFTFINNNRDNAYDVIVINDYNKMIVAGTINKTDYIVSDTNDASNRVVLDPEEKTILLFDAQGNKIDFSEIKTDNVLLVKENSNVTEVYVSSNTAAGTITSITDDDEIFIESKGYKVNDYAKDVLQTIKVGDNIKVSLDHTGKIAYVSQQPQSDATIMYLVDTMDKEENFEDDVLGKFYTTDGKLTTYSFADRVNVNGKSVKNLTDAALREKIKIAYKDGNQEKYKINQPVLVKFNSDNQINYLETAKKADSFTENEDGFCMTNTMARRRYVAPLTCFSTEIYFTSSTPFVILPTDVQTAEEKDFSVVRSSMLKEAEYYYVEAYAYSKNDEKAAFFLMEDATAQEGSVALQTPMSVVSKVTKAVNDDGDLMHRVYYTTKAGTDYAELPDGEEKVYTQNQISYKFTELKKGDAIRINTDKQKKVTAFRIHYQCNPSTILTAEDNSFNYKDRTVIRTVKKITSNYITIEKSGYNDQKLKMNNNYKVIVVKNKGDNIRYGTMDDLEVGDTALFQMYSSEIQVVIIYKD